MFPICAVAGEDHAFRNGEDVLQQVAAILTSASPDQYDLEASNLQSVQSSYEVNYYLDPRYRSDYWRILPDGFLQELE